jgi:hypothetical protein
MKSTERKKDVVPLECETTVSFRYRAQIRATFVSASASSPEKPFVFAIRPYLKSRNKTTSLDAVWRKYASH